MSLNFVTLNRFDIEQVIEKLFVKYHVKYCKRGLHLVSGIFN